MRRCYLVCYDIADPKRLRRVYKVMTGYGRPWQLSVFFCALKELDLARLEADLRKEMRPTADQVIIVDLGADQKSVRAGLTVLGLPLPALESGMMVV